MNGSPSNPTSAPNSNPPNATSFHPPSTAQYFPPQIGLNGVIPAPFSMVPPPHSQYNQHTIHPPHPNGNHANHGQAPPSNTHPTHNQHEFAIPPNHASYPIQRPNGNNINNGSNSSTDSNNNDSNKSPPSTTTGENGPNQQHPPNNGRVGWQFTLLPQQMPNINPMFGPGGYLPPDTYMRRVEFIYFLILQFECKDDYLPFCLL